MVAENISCDDDLSKRIDYTGRFREIAILSDANNRMLEKLEKMFRSQKQFNSDVAHELRNPMAIILAQCEYAKGQSVSQEDFEEIIDIIYRQTRKANDIVITFKAQSVGAEACDTGAGRSQPGGYLPVGL